MEKRIRSVTLDDARAVSEIYAPFVSDAATSFETVPPDAVEIQRRIKDKMPKYPWLVFEADGVVLGYAYGYEHRPRQAYQWSAAVSVYTHERARKRGGPRSVYRLARSSPAAGVLQCLCRDHASQPRQRSPA